MSAATAPVEPIRTARLAPVGADSPELLAHRDRRACCTTTLSAMHTMPVCDQRASEQPSGGAPEQPEAAEPPQRTAWSRTGWKSTAAFTIGRPPRAPRAG